MVKGIRTSAGAMRATLVAQDILANNLANRTVGFCIAHLNISAGRNVVIILFNFFQRHNFG